MLPSRRGVNERVIGYIPAGHESDATFEDVREGIRRLLGLAVDDVNWFSTYRVHHRVASRFADRRCFLLGDAGHLHSPVGGQGMNTGIGDAINLSWKLAAVLSGSASPALLESYEPERIAFARSLVATTDRAFKFIAGDGAIGTILRTWILPNAFPAATAFEGGRHALFRLLSQIRISYHDSPLSEGRAGSIRGGDRLPWIPAESADNFDFLRSLDWQAHVYGAAGRDVRDACEALDVALHEIAWSDKAQSAGSFSQIESEYDMT